MTKFNVINRSPYQISIVIPAPHRKTSFSITLEPSRSINLAPFAGSICECRRIAQIHDLLSKGWIEVIEE